MNYQNGKVYKVQFEDGHFYIGSTAGSLRQRFNNHRSAKNGPMSSCSKHIQEVGKDTCRIVLVEDYPCESREHLRRKEDEHIRANRDDPLCLNVRRALTTLQEWKEQTKEWRETHKEHIAEYNKQYADAHPRRVENPLVRTKMSVEERKRRGNACSRTYYAAHKEQALIRATQSRARLGKQHVNDLQVIRRMNKAALALFD
jgi:hypothetical protein